MTKSLAAKIFQDSWPVYQKIYDNNMMLHREISASLGAVYAKFCAGRNKVNFLDIGCGDGAVTASIFEQSRVLEEALEITAIDMSEVALAKAKHNLSKISHLRLIEGDMMDKVKEVPVDSISVAQALFSIHHLCNPNDKQLLLNQIYFILDKDGIFIWVDLFLLENESREDYLSRYVNGFTRKMGWQTILNEDELEMVDSHMLTSDYPSEEKKMIEFGYCAGFQSCERVWLDSEYQSSIGLIFRK